MVNSHRAQMSKHFKQNLWKYALLYAVLAAVFSTTRILWGSDDSAFLEATKNHTIISWVIRRYSIWSGRVFTETCIYLVFGVSRLIWYFLNPVFLLIASYSIARIAKENVVFNDVLLIVLLFLTMQINIISSSMLWMTGALNYLWPVAIILWGIIPYADAVFRSKMKLTIPQTILHTIALFLGCMGSEQAAVCATAFIFVSHICWIWQKKRVSLKLFLLSGASIAGLLIMLLSPGSWARITAETAHWYPEFDQLSLQYKLVRGITFTYEKLFNYAFILIFTFATMVILRTYLLNKQQSKSPVFQLKLLTALSMFGVCVIVLGITAIPDNDSQNLLYRLIFDFNRLDTLVVSRSFTLSKQLLCALCPYIFWSVFLLLLVSLIHQTMKREYFYWLCFSDAFFALLMMAFSPTVYVSKNRTVFVSATIIVLMIFDLLQQYQIDLRKLIFPIGAVSMINLFYLFSHYQNGFTVLY